MKPILVLDFSKDEQGRYILTREELDKLINDVYEMGKSERSNINVPMFRDYDITCKGNENIK